MEEAIIITLATICSALIGLIIRYSYRSKCEDVNCCFGLFKLHRDTRSEKEVTNTQQEREEDITKTI